MTDIDDWQSFLVRWSEEWADAQSSDSPADERPTPDEEPQRMRWLRFPPAAAYGHHVAAVRLIAVGRRPRCGERDIRRQLRRRSRCRSGADGALCEGAVAVVGPPGQPKRSLSAP
ncbi:hypothetical protein [Streptomyces sp. NPDC002758]